MPVHQYRGNDRTDIRYQILTVRSITPQAAYAYVLSGPEDLHSTAMCMCHLRKGIT